MRGFDYTFKKGERIGIVGKNGTGKSTFLKIALQLVPPDSGKINHGETIVFGNFSQEGLQYKEDKRAIEFVKDFAEYFPLADGSKISASQFMEKFGFTPQQQFTPLSKLSGGEKRRLHLLSILFKNPNFLVLDEPTNDLDLQTLRTLEEFLQDFPGCILIVSHDRYFMDRLVDHLFAFEGNGLIRDFPGNYSQYRMWKQLEENKPQNPEGKKQKWEGDGHSTESKMQNGQATVKQKLSFKEKTEFENLEDEIAELEKEKELLEVRLSNGSTDFEKLQETSEKINDIIVLIDKKETRWLELSERAAL
jgi:ATP-binding cassette subfamily F protein uup